MDVYLNRWTRSPPLSIHMSSGRKLYDFLCCRLDSDTNLGSAMRKKRAESIPLCTQGTSSGGFIQIHCPWFEWRYVVWWLIYFGDLVKGIGSLSLWFSPFHHFAILFLEVKPVFLPLERPAAHDWMPDICQFSLCGRWNPRERLPCCWHFLGLIGFFIFL